MQSSAKTVEEYIDSLPLDRKEAISKIREVIKKNLPVGYEEGMGYGMIVYHIPLARYPNTYNKQPLGIAALASQKNYISIYLMTVYGNPKTEAWFKREYEKAGKKLDMGKSCVRAKKLEDIPLDVIGKAVSIVTPNELIARYEESRKSRKH
ncbi:MAG: DUF1801 domain-containing protein [Candidatus Woykebacteria bacterium]